MDNIALRMFIETFAEDCLNEIKSMKHPNEVDVFNFGLASADASVRRVKTKWLKKIENDIKNEKDVND
jgi:hypothetical protein